MKTIESPCIQICKLENDICIGCGRTTQEIAEWGKATIARRKEIIERLPDRMRRM